MPRAHAATALLLTALGGCGDDAGGAGPDAGGRTDGTFTPCASDDACGDGLFCNGAERCSPADPTADVRGCAPAPTGQCPGMQVCNEATDSCGACLETDADGDGHQAIVCGGDDCDDDAPFVFMGAPETCDARDVDDDCDPSTPGDRDADGDGAIDAACCNRDASGARLCGLDCDDSRPGVGPTATETCNTLDDDCDALVDEGVRETFTRDVDGDGHGAVGGETVDACGAPMGFVTSADDCDDADASRHPGAADGPPGACNGRDDDCDTSTDEGCDCTEPASRACGTPAPGGGFLETGACTSGLETCTGGRWSACLGAVAPEPESCVGGDDESCDGESNEYCPCESLAFAATTASLGVRSGDVTVGGLRLHFVAGNVAMGPTPAWAEIEVRCAASGHLVRRFRRDVGDAEYFFHPSSADNFEVLIRVTAASPDGTSAYVMIST